MRQRMARYGPPNFETLIVNAEQFESHLLCWAKTSFAEEVRSEFRRAQKFDAPRTREQLSVVRSQPREALEILARVLPLGVLWGTPAALERCTELSLEERAAVETLKAEYGKLHPTHWAANLE